VGGETTEAMNALIKVSADVLSSLRVRSLAGDMEIDAEPEHLFSLEDCSNLSELTLDIRNPGPHLLGLYLRPPPTLDPARLGCLGKIMLTHNYVG